MPSPAIKTPQFVRGLARGLTADIIGGPVDLATLALNGGLAGYGYLGHKLGLLKPSEMPEPIENPTGGSDWFAGKNTPLTDDGSLGFTAGRISTMALPSIAKGLAKMPVQRDSSPSALGWHGTTAKTFDEFKPNIRKKEQLGFGIHFADERPFAELYALDPTIVRKKAGEPLLYKADLTYQNPLNTGLVQEGSPEFALAKKLAGKHLFSQKDAQGIPTAFLQNAIDATSPERASRLIQDAGFDAVRYNSRIGELLPGAAGLSNVRRSPSTVVFSPQQIKILERIVLERGLARGR